VRRPSGRAIGLDVGERRVGVAIADELGLLASPLATIERKKGDLGEIRDLAKTWGADRLIVGLPTGMSGREGPQAAAVRGFAEQLREMLEPETTVEYWDERLTTVVAERMLRASGARRDKRRDRVDALAAAVILQGYLDAQRSRAARSGEPHGGDAL
jgi:putative Holliday junction resolvase